MSQEESRKIGGWDELIREAEELLKKVEAKRARLKEAITTFRANKENDQPLPAT